MLVRDSLRLVQGCNPLNLKSYYYLLTPYYLIIILVRDNLALSLHGTTARPLSDWPVGFEEVEFHSAAVPVGDQDAAHQPQTSSTSSKNRQQRQHRCSGRIRLDVDESSSADSLRLE